VRDDFRPVAELISRATVLGGQLREFERDDWPHLRNREDFNQIYGLQSNERRSLEIIYPVGRDYAGQLGYLLFEFDDVATHPTFKGWVDTIEKFLADRMPKLRAAVDSVQMALDASSISPWAVGEMIALARQQLRISEALDDWLPVAKNCELYRQESGLPPSDSNDLSAASCIGSIRGAILAVEAVSSIATAVLVVFWIRSEGSQFEPWVVLVGLFSALCEVARREVPAYLGALYSAHEPPRAKGRSRP